MNNPLRQCLLSSAVWLGLLTLNLQPLNLQSLNLQSLNLQSLNLQPLSPRSTRHANRALAETPSTPNTSSPCPVPTTYTAPSPVNRIITVEEWKASFQVPNNYRALRAGQIIQVLSPESFAHFQCRRAHRLMDDNIPTSITLSFVEGSTTETAVRRQVISAAGSYLGETEIDGGRAFVHTSHVFWYTLHLSRPTPDQQNTIVFSAVLSDAGEIFYEETFDIIRGTFAFSDR